MFYTTDGKKHGLPHDPFKAIIAPRPIGWITSMSASGEINLAPYSYFNGVSSRPPVVCFSSEGCKDSVSFIEETREFVCSLATWDLRLAMNATSAVLPRGVNEMLAAGLTPASSRLVRPPRIAESPCALECRVVQIVSLADLAGNDIDRHVVFGHKVCRKTPIILSGLRFRRTARVSPRVTPGCPATGRRRAVGGDRGLAGVGAELLPRSCATALLEHRPSRKPLLGLP
jgi:flavin reductase (DIM6/NTAB) family NADH-FMN oxidoreductase RutF